MKGDHRTDIKHYLHSAFYQQIQCNNVSPKSRLKIMSKLAHRGKISSFRTCIFAFLVKFQVDFL